MAETNATSDYRSRIITHPDLLGGKPTIKGTRISVDLVLKRLSQDLDIEALLEAYPHLTVEDVKACLEYARSLVARAQRSGTEQQPAGAGATLYPAG